MHLSLLESLTLFLRSGLYPDGLSVTWLHQQQAPYLIYFFAAMACHLLLCLFPRVAYRQVSHSQWPEPCVRTPPSRPGHDCLGSCQVGKSSMEIFTRWNSAKQQAVLRNQHGFGDTAPLLSKRHGGICGNPAVADSGIYLPSSGDSHLSLAITEP